MLSESQPGPRDGKNASDGMRAIFGHLFSKWDVPHSTIKVAIAAAAADELTGINVLRMLWMVGGSAIGK